MTDVIPLGSLEPSVLRSTEGLKPFIWCYHNYSTTYLEQYQRVGGEGSNQGYVPRRESRPSRLFALRFETMIHLGKAYGGEPELCAYGLERFYQEHGLHRPFSYKHPVYGQLKVVFNKPLSLPARRLQGQGTLESFEVELREVVTRSYLFHPLEQTLRYPEQFPFIFNNHAVDYPEDSVVLTLGDGAQVRFRTYAPKLRSFRVTVAGLGYQIRGGHLSFVASTSQNLLALEAFYNHYRLDLPFYIELGGECVRVVFKNPLKIDYIQGNTGKVPSVQIELREYLHEDLRQLPSGEAL